MKLIILLTVIACAANKIESARILAIFQVPSYSHQILGHTLFEELDKRGHEITLVTPIPPKTPLKNGKSLQLQFDTSQHEENRKTMFDLPSSGPVTKVLMTDLMGLWLTEMTLNQTIVQELLKSDQKFDLIIYDHSLNDAFKGFCYHYKSPRIAFNTIGPTRWSNPQMGNPGPPSYVPDILVTVSSNMNIWERCYNTLVYTGAELFYNFYTFRKQNELLQKYFPGAPSLHDLHYNTSFMLLNSHVSTHSPVPLVPNMVSIGGFHIKPPKKLPDDLQQYLDNSKHGVIFFSMGSNLQSSDIPPEKLDAILKSLSKLKQNVLWKFEKKLPGQPQNVKIEKWLPQNDILAHPNVKLFISHGGLLSVTEAVYHGVPLLGIPIYGDQEMNIAKAENSGFAVGVPYPVLTEETFGKALNEILYSLKYSKNAKEKSRIMHDQPMKPLDTAVFWVEYVIRHQGAPHLRTAALQLTWYQYMLLDVIGVAVLMIFITVYIFKKLLKRLFCKNNVKIVNRNKKTK